MKFLRKTALAIVAACGILITQQASAGLIFFSRANCVNNESITWDWPGNNFWLFTFGQHYDYQRGAWEPMLSTGWEYTYRSAAIHWGEGFRGGYYVVGDHYMWVTGYGTLYMGRSQTAGCNLSSFFPYW